MKKNSYIDPFLKERLARYDNWLSKNKISHSSKVVPIHESLDTTQYVLPTERAIGIIRRARSVAVANCECREHYRRCDNPLEVCLLLNDVGDKYVSEGDARRIQVGEAVEILKRANERGLIHLTLYRPDHEIYALCSCCSCCCHELQIVELFGRKDLMVRSDYVAVTESEACIDCGRCVDRCIFGARVFENKKTKYDANACMGCGLCATICPVGATSMEVRSRNTE